MIGKRTRQLLWILVWVALLLSASPPVVMGSGPADQNAGAIRLAVSGAGGDQEIRRLLTIVPAAAEMVDRAIDALLAGWSAMEPAEREAFQLYFDPAKTGEIDERFVGQVLDNYRQIRAQLSQSVRVEFEADSEICDLMRLYYTDLVRVHVCPYFATETREERMARQWVHELTHIALLVVDRSYYQPTSIAYAALTPRGSWTAQLPLIGPILREIAHSDTLYHPDAYARFAAALVAEPRAEPGPAPPVLPSAEGVVDMAILRHQGVAAAVPSLVRDSD